MRDFILYGALALILFSLVVLARRDWPRLTRPNQRVRARVVGHARRVDIDSESWAPIYSFTTPEGPQEVVDQTSYPTQRPEPGSMVDLAYPLGRPELARPPARWQWIWVYAVLLYGAGVIAAKIAGLI